MQPLLVLWDVDYTLVASGGVGVRLYELALAQLYGVGLPAGLTSMAGRTDTSIALEVLAAAGLPDPSRELPAFHAVLAARAGELAGLMRESGRVLPGVPAVLAALAGRADDGVGPLVQSVLTGNIPALARVKLGPLGLTDYLDLEVGAYGDVSAVRGDLVPVARRRAAARYGADFAGLATVLVGDTPLDIDAAAQAGARAVGVATGRFSASDLAAAGADVVLPDLTDTAAAVAAVLGRPYGETSTPARSSYSSRG